MLPLKQDGVTSNGFLGLKTEAAHNCRSLFPKIHFTNPRCPKKVTQNMMTESNFLGTQPPLKMSLQFCIESKKRERAGCQLEVQQACASFATFQTASKKRPRLCFS